MKELIKKVLREEVQKRFSKGTSNAESIIIKHMEKLLSKTTRILPPPEENYGIFNEEWCKGSKIVVEARYHLDDETDEFFSGDLYVDNTEIDFLSNVLQVRKAYILNVITEWYDDNYASKFGPEVNHPEFEIFEAFVTDSNRKCYEMVDVSNIGSEDMIEYLDKHSLYRADELRKLPEDELKSRYRSVYNIQLNN
jgi:hypothetical protein